MPQEAYRQVLLKYEYEMREREEEAERQRALADDIVKVEVSTYSNVSWSARE